MITPRGMDVPPIVLIVASVVLGVAGQLALKAGLGRLGPLALGEAGPVGIIRRILSVPTIWGGLAVYGVGTFFWLVALSQVELGYAYPFISLSYVLILLTSWLFFREELSWWRVLGVVAIGVGVFVAAG